LGELEGEASLVLFKNLLVGTRVENLHIRPFNEISIWDKEGQILPWFILLFVGGIESIYTTVSGEFIYSAGQL